MLHVLPAPGGLKDSRMNHYLLQNVKVSGKSASADVRAAEEFWETG